jgi:hypothetical protein
MQAITDQRWHELCVEVDRERLVLTTHGQTPEAKPQPPLQLLFVNAMRMLQPMLARRLETRISGAARRTAIT